MNRNLESLAVARIGEGRVAPAGLRRCVELPFSVSRVAELLRDHHFRRAREVLQAHAGETPDGAEVFWLRSWSEHAWGNLPEARELAEQAVALNAGDARFALRLAEACIDSARQKSTGVLLKLRLVNQFREQIGRALQLEPKGGDALRCLIQFHLQAPATAGGSKEKARQLALRLGAADPAEGALATATMAEAAGQSEVALTGFRDAVARNPSHHEALIALARALLRVGSHAEAELHALNALRLKVGHVAAYEVLAELFCATARWEALEALWGRLAVEVGDNFSPFFHAGVACSRNAQNLERARLLLERYVETEPEPNYPTLATAHWRLGQVAESMNDLASARQSFATSIRCNANSPARADLARLTE